MLLIAEEPKPYAFGDFLYWYTSETVDWAVTSKVGPSSQTIRNRTVTFDWDTGFRVGIGYNMKHDGWDTRLYYTWFYTRALDRINRGSVAITPGFLANRTAAGGTYQSAKLSFRLRFNMFDWELGRRFFASEALSLRPFIGVKGGWIHQTIQTRWRREELILGIPVKIDAWENVKNLFQGVGPKLGLNGKWILGQPGPQYFSLVGDFAGSFLWGWWRIRDRFHNNSLLTATTKVMNRHFGALVLQALMGFGWDYDLPSGPSHFSAKLGYEIQNWFNQFQLFDNTTGTRSNNLIFQGVTLDLRLDF